MVAASSWSFAESHRHLIKDHDAIAASEQGRSPVRRALREGSLVQRILRVYVVRADVRVGAALAQADRETETDPVAHVLHVARGAGLHPPPFVTEAASLEPELDAALAFQRRPPIGHGGRRPGRERLAGRGADHGGADTVDLAHRSEEQTSELQARFG